MSAFKKIKTTTTTKIMNAKQQKRKCLDYTGRKSNQINQSIMFTERKTQNKLKILLYTNRDGLILYGSIFEIVNEDDEVKKSRNVLPILIFLTAYWKPVAWIVSIIVNPLNHWINQIHFDY
ncbi:hypothetical protein DERP_010885 [Dermatophagoides pteronyssinus]|uniref:Uncharacterized protein n=1 Tax=Dermatophagoides pteronyssinus TaxID=6956 RepID=A0ABQ8JUR7_DERPT|nr:hypothetical protein DERP_010885 [Dermatophagoides pteronyssinus]